MARMEMEVRLSQCAQEFMIAAVALLEAVVNGDRALLEDSIQEAADNFLSVIEGNRGML